MMVVTNDQFSFLDVVLFGSLFFFLLFGFLLSSSYYFSLGDMA